MKLFEEFEAVKFHEENLILITNNSYIYYIYNPLYNSWRKHRNAGNNSITVSNYEEISEDELIDAMGGKLPQKETDFIRLCHPVELCMYDMLALLEEDYPEYMDEDDIYYTIYSFLLDSNIYHKSYTMLRELLDKATATNQDKAELLSQIKQLSYDVIGRDIYKEEIRIVDGRYGSSYFRIMPVRIVDFSDTDSMDSVAEMKSNEISIEENDVAQYLTPFLYKYFDEELEANKHRLDINGFEWYLTYNFFTFESIEHILKDIRDTVDALSTGRVNEYTAKLKEKRGMATYELLYAKDLNDEQIAEYNANRPTEDDTEPELIIDFYRRFLYRMEYMMKAGKENGYNLISFMGP